MLNLRRRVGQSIRIGEDVYLTIIKNDGDEVHLSFDAPVDIKIERDEVHRAKEREKRQGIVHPVNIRYKY